MPYDVCIYACMHVCMYLYIMYANFLCLYWFSLVQRIRDNFGSNRALCDKSTKFGTVVVYAKVTILKIGGTLKMP